VTEADSDVVRQLDEANVVAMTVVADSGTRTVLARLRRERLLDAPASRFWRALTQGAPYRLVTSTELWSSAIDSCSMLAEGWAARQSHETPSARAAIPPQAFHAFDQSDLA
jgi:hypothetical protein